MMLRAHTQTIYPHIHATNTHRSPVKEVVYAVRAITPLLVALVLLVTVVLRQPLPAKGFTDMDEEEEEDAQQQRDKEQQKDAKMAAGKDASDVEVCSDQVGLWWVLLGGVGKPAGWKDGERVSRADNSVHLADRWLSAECPY